MDFTGPAGALALAVVILGVAGKVIQELWNDHKRSDQDDRDERDRAWELIAGITPTLEKLAAAQEASNQDAVGRRRRDDDT